MSAIVRYAPQAGHPAVRGVVWEPRASFKLRVPPASFLVTRIVCKEFVPTCAADVYALANDSRTWSAERYGWRLVYDFRRPGRPYLTRKQQPALGPDRPAIADPDITITVTVTDLPTTRTLGAPRATITTGA